MATQNKAPEPIDVKGIPNFGEMFGQSNDGPFPFTPEADFTRFSIPKDLWYSFKLEPLTAKQKRTVEGWIREISIKAMLWAKENKLNIVNFSRRFATPEDVKQCEKLGLPPEDCGFFPVDISEDEKSAAIAEKMAYTKQLKALENELPKYELIRSNVVGLSKYKNAQGKPTKFKKQKDQSGIDETLWGSIPGKVQESVYQELLEKSNLTIYEVASL